MDLITLKSDMQPGKLIENYDSLIWTERFNTLGDFQLVTGNVDEYRAMLPEGMNLSLRESTVPMIVETHQIVRKKNVGAQLIIKGREYTSILDRRVSVKTVHPDANEWNVVVKTPSDVAHYVITKICVEGICDVADIFPSATVVFNTPADYLLSTGPNRQFSIQRGNLLSTVLSLLQTEAAADPSTTPATPVTLQHGIKAIRPNAAGTSIAIEIYVGTDKSATVYFDGTRDQLDDGSYLFSKVGSANVAYTIGPTIGSKIAQTTPVPTGLDRRVILVDGIASGIENAESIKAEGSRALSEAHVTAMYNGTINQDLSTYKYGVDYKLGDIVKLVGDYGLVEKARVTEYIRSEDATGSKAYPTLQAIPSYL